MVKGIRYSAYGPSKAGFYAFTNAGVLDSKKLQACAERLSVKRVLRHFENFWEVREEQRKLADAMVMDRNTCWSIHLSGSTHIKIKREGNRSGCDQ